MEPLATTPTTNTFTKHFLLYGGALVVTLCCGIGIGYIIHTPTNEVSTEIRLDDNTYRFINPLLDYQDNTPPLLRKNIIALESDIKDILDQARQDGYIANASIYYRDLENGPWFSINDELLYRPASLLKLPLMIAFYKIAEQNPAILTEKITYTTPITDAPAHSINGLPSRLVLGQTYTVEELISAMIIDSDNIATILLQEHINPEQTQQVFEDFAAPYPNASLVEANFMRAQEYASFFRVLYNGTYLNRTYSERALELLSKTRFTDGLAAGIPAGIPLSHKFGVSAQPTGEKQLHDCGIIYDTQTKTYVLCVMTTGDDYRQMADVIRDVATTVHNAMQHRE